MLGPIGARHRGVGSLGRPPRRVILAALFLTTACSDLAGPDRSVAPRLRALAIDDLATSLRQGGIIYINGYPEDTAFRLESQQRAPVEVSVTSGDRETVGLFRLFCPPRQRSWGYHCFDFSVVMQDGFTATDISGLVAGAGGRFNIVSVSGRYAAVTMFDPGDLVRRARQARSWPGVAYTELVFPGGCLQAVQGCASQSDLLLPLPVDTGAAVLGDGIVQVRSGDTVSVSYRQPDGLTIEARRRVP